MAYSVRIERIGGAGLLPVQVQVYDAVNEADAITIAAHEIDARRYVRPRVAIVSDAAGRVMFTYIGRASRDDA